MSIAERIDVLVQVLGSLREVSRLLGIDVGYLSRLRSGDKDEPSEEMLRKLGLRRVVSYDLIRHPAVAAVSDKSLLREPLKPGERLVCYCPPGVCQAPPPFRGPCNRATAPKEST